MNQIMALFLVLSGFGLVYYVLFRLIIKGFRTARETKEKGTDFFVTSNKNNIWSKILVSFLAILVTVTILVFLYLDSYSVSGEGIKRIICFLWGIFFVSLGGINIKHTFVRIRKNGFYPFGTSIFFLIFGICLGMCIFL